MTARLSLIKRLYRELRQCDLPISTPDLIALHATGLRHPRSRVWAELRKLIDLGMVRKCRRGPVAYWTRVSR